MADVGRVHEFSVYLIKKFKWMLRFRHNVILPSPHPSPFCSKWVELLGKRAVKKRKKENTRFHIHSPLCTPYCTLLTDCCITAYLAYKPGKGNTASLETDSLFSSPPVSQTLYRPVQQFPLIQALNRRFWASLFQVSLCTSASSKTGIAGQILA